MGSNPTPAARLHRKLQTANRGDEKLLLYVYGTPPETQRPNLDWVL